MNSGECIPRWLCLGVSEQNNKKVLNGIGFLVSSAARSFNKSEKYYWKDIFEKFIEPHFSISDYIIFFEWDRISRNYRYVVTPIGNKNKFISFYLHKYERVDDFNLVVIYTSVGEFEFHNT